MARATGRPPPELKALEIPAGCESLLTAWNDLHGQETLGPQDIAAWQQIMGVRLTPWEASVLLRLSAHARSATPGP